MHAIPPCIDTILRAWNTRDIAAMEILVEEALTPNVAFCDPHYDIRGHTAFIAMVKVFFDKYPDAKIMRTSAIDSHHDRARYTWAIVAPDGRRFDGFDAVAIDLASNKVRRVDGYFGALKPA